MFTFIASWIALQAVFIFMWMRWQNMLSTQDASLHASAICYKRHGRKYG